MVIDVKEELWFAKGEMFIICSKNSCVFDQSKYICQTWNIKSIKDVKEQKWLTKIFEAVSLILHGH